MWSDKSMQGGGGFLDQTYGGDTTQQTPKSGPTRSSSVVPLMIAHLLDENPDGLNLWGKPIKLVRLVAVVKKIDRTSTKISYDLEDETGSLKAFQWIDVNDAELETVPEGSYANIVGSLRTQADTCHLFILKIKEVDFYNDIYEHLLEVTYQCRKARKDSTLGEQGMIGTAMDEAEGNTYNGMDKEQGLVFELIQGYNDTVNGAGRDQLKQKMPANLRDRLDTIVDFLVGEGHIYTTCTDDHFKTT